MLIATIVCRREVARARVLAASAAKHAAATSVIALVLDATAEDQHGREEPFELLCPSDAAIDDFGTLAGMLTAAELREASKPRLLAHLLGRAPGQSVLYLDPDSLVCGQLDDVERLVADHGVLVKTRTARSLPPDGRRPNEADLRGWGLHDDGLIALGAGHDHHAMLDWWAARGRAGSGPQGGSLPIERVATLGRGAYEIGDDGLGASFWDLYDRTIAAHEHSILIDGSPLRLMRFPGFDPHRPLSLSDAQSRLRVAEQPALAALCERYATLLVDAGEIEASQLPYAFDRLPDGTQLDHRLRTIYRLAVEEAGLRRSPFTLWGMEEFYAWLGEPAATGRALGINRLCMLVRDEQPELREAYPDLDQDAQAYGLIEWLHQHGVREGTLPVAVVPPTSPDEREAERRRRARTTNFGVNVAGYFTAEIGIGEAVRLLVAALDAAAVPLLPLSPPTLPSSRKDHQYVSLPISAPGFPVNLICINADGLLRFREEVGSGFFDGRYNIGLWWWEVDRLPAEWHAGFELLDEVWVGSEHVACALSPISPIPVYTVRIPILARNTAPLDRAAIGLGDEWVFLSMFDHGSVVERKNPLGTIAAFTEAFSPSSGAALILKSVNAEHDHFGRDRVRAAAAPHPHVHLMEGHLSPVQTHALIATADCFVSLHRAEGLGLVPAEAMALGKPVIATGYSGNLDYMTRENAYLVDYALRAVGPGCWPYPEDAVWADADLGHAAELMREVFEDQSAARGRGALAATQLAETHSLQAAGRSMRSRIESVAARWEGEPFLPLPEFEVDLIRGRRGRLLRRLAPGVLAMLEHELEQLWAANEQRKFDLDAAAKGTLLSTQAATLAALRRVERAAHEPLREPEPDPRATGAG
ncbi:MAG TPA: glycosyltransferase [Solirubrobacteraceae bacterium]|nr:glycosyltransferase [Solirubrobacteraceae bacterium]